VTDTPGFLRFSAAPRSPPYRHRGSRNGNRRAAYATREQESRGRIAAPFRRDQARLDGGDASKLTVLSRSEEPAPFPVQTRF
jgi:hypothetical protein